MQCMPGTPLDSPLHVWATRRMCNASSIHSLALSLSHFPGAPQSMQLKREQRESCSRGKALIRLRLSAAKQSKTKQCQRETKRDSEKEMAITLRTMHLQVKRVKSSNWKLAARQSER